MKLYFHEHSDNNEVFCSTGSSLLSYKYNVRKDKYIDVEIVDLCGFIKSLDRRIKILKMDIEGAECPILEKIINTGALDAIDHIFVETHDHKIPELVQETNRLRALVRVGKKINLNWN